MIAGVEIPDGVKDSATVVPCSNAEVSEKSLVGVSEQVSPFDLVVYQVSIK